jgi:probable F420-dependent oxidoreductase
MQFFVACNFPEPSEHLAIAKAAEVLEFDGISVSDHLFLPSSPRTPYPYTGDGRLPFAIETPWPDPLVTLAAVGAVTTKLRLLTHVYVLPLRNPLIVAKLAATAASLCEGRLMMGIGTGWLREEFDAVGAPFVRRGAIADESILLLRELWETGRLGEYRSRYFHFPSLVMLPRPATRIPILVGGESDRALERAANLGDGYISIPHTIDELEALLRDLRKRLRDRGRDESFHINAPCDRHWDVAQIARLADIGVSSVNVSAWTFAERDVRAMIDSLRQFHDSVVAPFRARYGSG